MGNMKDLLKVLPTDFLHECLLKVPFFVTILDMQGSVIFFNKHAESLTGYQAPFITGKDFIEFFISQEQKEAFSNYFFCNTSIKDVQKSFFCILQTKNKGTRYMEWTGIKEKHGREDYLILIGKDLTESFSKVSNLLSQILHEVNNSTTFIIGNAPFLKEAWNDIQKIMDIYSQQDTDFEIARLPYSFFREDYPQVIEDIETGCRRIRNIVTKFKEIERIIHEQKK